MIFSLLGARPRRVSGISYGPRAQWPRLFGTFGESLLTTMRFDMWNGERRKRAVNGTMLARHYFPMRLHLLHVISSLERLFPRLENEG